MKDIKLTLSIIILDELRKALEFNQEPGVNQYDMSKYLYEKIEKYESYLEKHNELQRG